VPPAPWLQLKDKERVSDMPMHLEMLPTDKIGWLYNLARKEVEDFFSAKLAIADFHGLISGEHFTKEMSQECRLVNRIYADEVGKLIKEKQALQDALAKAEAEFEAKRNDPETRNQARSERGVARSAVRAHKERSREEFQALRSLITPSPRKSSTRSPNRQAAIRCKSLFPILWMERSSSMWTAASSSLSNFPPGMAPATSARFSFCRYRRRGNFSWTATLLTACSHSQCATDRE
jgi:hypothetical protein